MTRTDAVLLALHATFRDLEQMVEDPELRGVTVEVRVDKDGLVRVVLFTPTYARQTADVGVGRRMA